MVIKVHTSDQIIWNLQECLVDICWAMSRNEPIELDMNREGPDLESIGLNSLLTTCAEKFNYNTDQISIVEHCNFYHDTKFKKQFRAPMHFVISTLAELKDTVVPKVFDKHMKHFGLFISRGDPARLALSSYLFNQHKNKTVQTYHYTPHNDQHSQHLAINELVAMNPAVDLTPVINFINHCPIIIDEVTYPIVIGQHLNIFNKYSSLFAEVVCETYYTGNTFFTTEKIWRPIALQTPFIVQGPKDFLRNLKALGFKTFDRWWSEEYSEDPPNVQVQHIQEIIKQLSNKPLYELAVMYEEMKPILEHNRRRLATLGRLDFMELYEQQ